jgi:hypothetical protein
MLALRYIKKIYERGFGSDCDFSIRGDYESPIVSDSRNERGRTIRISLNYEVDRRTGDLRIVQR